VSRRKQIVTLSALALVSVMLLVMLLAVSLTQTEYGKGQVRRYVQSWVNGKVRGKFYVGKITGGLFNGVTIDSIEIRDENDSLFLATGRIRVRYDARDIFDRRIVLSHLDVTRPVVHVFELPTGEWNYHRIFP
jgi:translocation and assembly module TamB